MNTEPPFICLSVQPSRAADAPCPDCGHRIGSHALVARGGGTCDVCAIIRAVRAALGDPL